MRKVRGSKGVAPTCACHLAWLNVSVLSDVCLGRCSELQVEFLSMLKEALSLCGQYEGHRFRELHDAIRRYIVFESSVFANCQVSSLSSDPI